MEKLNNAHNIIINHNKMIDDVKNSLILNQTNLKYYNNGIVDCTKFNAMFYAQGHPFSFSSTNISMYNLGEYIVYNNSIGIYYAKYDGGNDIIYQTTEPIIQVDIIILNSESYVIGIQLKTKVIYFDFVINAIIGEYNNSDYLAQSKNEFGSIIDLKFYYIVHHMKSSFTELTYNNRLLSLSTNYSYPTGNMGTIGNTSSSSSLGIGWYPVIQDRDMTDNFPLVSTYLTNGSKVKLYSIFINILNNSIQKDTTEFDKNGVTSPTIRKFFVNYYLPFDITSLSDYHFIFDGTDIYFYYKQNLIWNLYKISSVISHSVIFGGIATKANNSILIDNGDSAYIHQGYTGVYKIYNPHRQNNMIYGFSKYIFNKNAGYKDGVFGYIPGVNNILIDEEIICQGDLHE